MKDYDCWLGPFDHEWKHPPQPFNPDYRPDWRERQEKVSRRVAEQEPFACRGDRAKAYAKAYEELDQ